MKYLMQHLFDDMGRKYGPALMHGPYHRLVCHIHHDKALAWYIWARRDSPQFMVWHLWQSDRARKFRSEQRIRDASVIMPTIITEEMLRYIRNMPLQDPKIARKLGPGDLPDI